MVALNSRFLPPDKGFFHLGLPEVAEPGDGQQVRQILHGGMWPSQRLWWDMPNFVKLFVGGYGSGKTFQLGKRMIHLALVNAPAPVAVVSPTYTMARETVVLTISSLLSNMKDWFQYWRKNEIRDVQFDFSLRKTAPFEFTIKYQFERNRPKTARILVYSGEDPEKLKGPNLAAAGIDEPFIQPLGVFEQMTFRVRHPKAVVREVNLTGTPEQLNWGYDLAEGELAEKHDVGIVQASTLENLSLPTDYVQRLVNAMDEKAAEAYVHGLFVNLTAGLVYYGFDRQENVVELPMPRGAVVGAGMDFNVNPMSAAPFWAIEKGSQKHIHFFDEIELPNSDTQDMCKLLIEKYGQGGLAIPHAAEKDSDMIFLHAPMRDIYPDCNVGRSTMSPGGKTDYDYIKEAGFTIHSRPSGNPARRDRFNTQNGMLRPKNGRVRMTFSPRCKKMIKYQMLYSHEKMKKQESMSHLLDARDYAVFELFPADRVGLKLKPLIGV